MACSCKAKAEYPIFVCALKASLVSRLVAYSVHLDDVAFVSEVVSH